MEFPSLGEHCQEEGCNQTDFLPLQCKCGKVFCRFHFNDHCLSGNCDLAPKPEEFKLKSEAQIFKCSQPNCPKRNLHEILCPKCNKHYCIEHRFHKSCPEIDEEILALKREQFEAPKRQFNEVNKHLQEKITENIRRALQSSAKVKTASKIHLMRVKQKATGPKSVPLSCRVYFAITKPANCDAKSVKVVQDINWLVSVDALTLDPNLKNSVPVFVSSEWTLGRALDSICETCNIFNENNKIGTCKARLFRELDGYCISPVKMDVQIVELVKREILLEGDRLIIEYISEGILKDLNEGSQVFLDVVRDNL